MLHKNIVGSSVWNKKEVIEDYGARITEDIKIGNVGGYPIYFVGYVFMVYYAFHETNYYSLFMTFFNLKIFPLFLIVLLVGRTNRNVWRIF